MRPRVQSQLLQIRFLIHVADINNVHASRFGPRSDWSVLSFVPPTGQTSNDASRELIREARPFYKDGPLSSEAASLACEGDLVRKNSRRP